MPTWPSVQRKGSLMSGGEGGARSCRKPSSTLRALAAMIVKYALRKMDPICAISRTLSSSESCMMHRASTQR